MKESNKKIVKKTVLENRTNKKDTVPSAKAMPETKSQLDISNDHASLHRVIIGNGDGR